MSGGDFMKKFLSVILVLSVVIMTACGGKTYERGVYTETGFDSEFLGFRYTTPEGYQMADEEELDELMGIVADVSGDSASDRQEEYANLENVHEMVVSDATGACNMNITLDQKVMPVNRYINLFKEQLQNVPDMDVTLDENVEKTVVAGKTYRKLKAAVRAYGMSMNQEYYIARNGDRMVGITVTYFDGMEDGRDALMNGFSAY